jgi:hypothetical protein
MYRGFFGVMPGMNAVLHSRLSTAAPGFATLQYAP